MKQQILLTLALGFLLNLPLTNVYGTGPEDHHSQDTTHVDEKDKLVILWTSGDKEVATKMVFMYTYNANKYKWWDDITLLIWGPSAKLLTEDIELQDYVKKMKSEGINLLACKGCADIYEISEKLEEIGVTVRYTGVDLTNYIKERHVITF